MSQLARVIKGKIVKPLRTLIYGVEGVGKSSFAADAPAPIFLPTEAGTEQLDVARLPAPSEWADVTGGLHELLNGTHDYKTLVIDTLDHLEPLIWRAVLASRLDPRGRPYKAIGDIGFQAGYEAALDVWRELTSKLDRLRDDRGMNIVLVAHSTIKNFKNPEGDDYDRYQLKLHKSASGFLREWADDVLFAAYETYTHEKDGRAKGIASGARVVHTERMAAWDAKNRHDLPATLALDWSTYAQACEAHAPESTAVMREQIGQLLPSAPAADRQRVTTAVLKAGDNARELARILNKLTATATINDNNKVTT